MDPNENIKRQRELCAEMLDRDLTHTQVTNVGYELAELSRALDEWRLKGGFDPYETHSIHRRMDRVREHPDFVFGTVFTCFDFPDSRVPTDFPASKATDALAERGNEFIEGRVH